MHRARPYPQAHRQRGAAGVLFAVSAMGLFASLAMAIDIGRLYGAQRELQRAANLAALDAARVANGCAGHVDDANALNAANAEVVASLTRNNAQQYLSADGGVRLGRLQVVDGFRSFVPLGGDDAGTRTAVQVRLQRPAPARLLPLTPGSSMVAVASADSRPQVSFAVGSGLASVNEGLVNDLLGGLVGGSLSLSAAAYQGLVDASVTLGDLAIAAGVATVDDYLTAQTSLGNAFDDILNALGDGESGVVRDALTTLANAAAAGRQVTPGDVLLTPLGLGGATDNALVNVGQLVMALAQSANGSNAISVPLNVNILGVASVNAGVRLIEPMQVAVGVRAGDRESYAATAQGRVNLNVNLGLLGLAAVSLPVSVEVARATAQLDELRCAGRGSPEHQVAINTTTSLATVGIGTFTSPVGSPSPTLQPATIVSVLGLARVKLGLLVNAGQAQEEALEFEGPFPAPVQSVETSAAAAIDSALSGVGKANLQVELLGLPLGLDGLLNSVASLITPVLGTLTESLIEPVLSVLGVSLGNADVTVLSMSPVNASGPLPEDPTEPLSLQAFLFDH